MAAAVKSGNHAEVTNFLSLGSLASQAHPAHDHFLPLLYSLAGPDAEVRGFCEGFQWRGVSMRPFVLA